MIATIAGRSVWAALCLCIAAWPASPSAQAILVVETKDNAPLGQLPFDQGQEICLRWNHSVTGGAVVDCFENIDDKLTLSRSYLHDFAAGLGEIAGRGSIAPAPEGGYWITGINEEISGNALPLRVGAKSVDHRLTSDSETLALSQLAAGTLVLLRLQPN